MNADLSVGQKVHDFVKRRSRDREVLGSVIQHLAATLPHTVIFGGMIREFGLGNAREFSSDIDLVSEATDRDIDKAVAQFDPVRNKFGGFRFRVGKWRFDVWSFRQTWAFRNEIIEGRQLRDLLRSTFFNVDAAIFHLSNRHLEYSKAFVSGISQRVLDINLSENPAPERMAAKALKLALENNLMLSGRLASFVLEYQRELQATSIYGALIDNISKLVRHTPEPYDVRPRQFSFFASDAEGRSAKRERWLSIPDSTIQNPTIGPVGSSNSVWPERSPLLEEELHALL